MSASESRPSFPFYGREFFSSRKVRALTAAQRGVYLSLLWSQWESGPIATRSRPDRDPIALLSQSEGVAIDDIQKVIDLCFEPAEGGGYINTKLEEIRRELDDFKARQRAAGAAGNEKRWGRDRDPIATRSRPDPTGIAKRRSASASSSASASDKNRMEASPPPVAGSGPQETPASGRGGNNLTRDWSALWQQYRGEPWAGTKANALSLAQCLKFANGNRDELWKRARRMLDSTDTLDVPNASPEWLAKRWNKFAVDLRPVTKAEQGDQKLFEALDRAGVK